MIYFLALCVLFAVTAISVTSTVCAFIVIATFMEELRKHFRKSLKSGKNERNGQ